MPAGKGQQLLDKTPAPLGCRKRALDAAHRGGIFRNIAPHQLQVGLNDLQDIVEIVRHAAGELSGSLHFLSLAQLRLDSKFVGDVDTADYQTAIGHDAGEDLVFMPGHRNPRC